MSPLDFVPLSLGSSVSATKTTNSQAGTAYTLGLGDAGNRVEMTSASVNTITVPANATVAFPIGTTIEIFRYGLGQTIIAAAGGVTIDSEGNRLRIPARFCSATLWKRGSDEWVLTFIVQASRDLNVLDFGAVGDGVNDDTSAIQAALNQLNTSPPNLGSAAPAHIYFPAGTYKLTSALNVPLTNYSFFEGAGIGVSILLQTTAGQPIFTFQYDLTHSITMRDLSLEYNADQTNAASVAVLYHVAGGTTGGFFHHLYERLHIKSAYDGFTLYGADGSQTIWDSTWRNVLFEHIKHSCVSFQPATVVGIPNDRFYDIAVRNTGTPAIQSTGPAFEFQAVNEVLMYGLDLEGWYDTLIDGNSGACVDIRVCHIEHHVFNAAISRCFTITNGPMTIDTLTVNGDTTAGNTTRQVLAEAGVNGRLTMNNIKSYATNSLGSAPIHELMYGFVGDNSVLFCDPDTFKIESGVMNIPGFGTNGASVGELLKEGRRQLTWAAAGTIAAVDLYNFGPRRYWINVPSNTSSTMGTPTNPGPRDTLAFEIINGSGGALTGTLTFPAAFHLAGGVVFPLSSIASTKRRVIGFHYDPVNSIWVEDYRSTADV